MNSDIESMMTILCRYINTRKDDQGFLTRNFRSIYQELKSTRYDSSIKSLLTRLLMILLQQIKYILRN